MKRIQLLIITLFLSVIGCGSPMVYTHGVPNLVQVDPYLWRSGQPTTKEGWHYLASLGIKEVIKLNDVEEGSDDGAIAEGMLVVPLTIVPEDDHPLSVFEEPSKEKIQAALDEMETATPGHAILVHCTHGQDRTGAVIGKRRRQHDHWKKSQAWKEMLKNHFHPEIPGLMDYWMDN